MAIKLFLTANDIPKHTSLSGNIDIDSLNPFIYISQKTQIKRILGNDLYDKILTDLENETPLTGDYLTLFNDYVIDMLVYFSTANYLSFGSYKITNNGINKPLIDGGTSTDFKEVNTLIERYKQLATDVELNFYEYMKTITIPEWGVEEENKEQTQIIRFY